jgi:hypothetical protein
MSLHRWHRVCSARQREGRGRAVLGSGPRQREAGVARSAQGEFDRHALPLYCVCFGAARLARCNAAAAPKAGDRCVCRVCAPLSASASATEWLVEVVTNRGKVRKLYSNMQQLYEQHAVMHLATLQSPPANRLAACKTLCCLQMRCAQLGQHAVSLRLPEATPRGIASQAWLWATAAVRYLWANPYSDVQLLPGSSSQSSWFNALVMIASFDEASQCHHGHHLQSYPSC